MKKIFSLALMACVSLGSAAQINIIPKPKSVNVEAGAGSVTRKVACGNIKTEIVDSIPGISSPEGYRLEITPEGADIKAISPQGLFYGNITLEELCKDGNAVPVCTITDEPRFEYRGMMLDISRHFRDKEFIKKQIDAMARLKLNHLHLHLTDAAGWRLEIKRYPQLTDYAAWRKGATWKEWNENGNKYAHEGESDATGGYLTQEDAKELVAYAAAKNITIIPEIEMPSHSEEVTATFPELSCTHNPGGASDFCVGNEATFEFIENVLDEVISIFPSKVIHIGGDEASKQAWKECGLCQKRMEENSLETVDELQSYLIHRVEQYLNSKGRDLLGWDEIMEGGLAPNAAVMSWRGTEGGLKAAAAGHRAIMSPGGYCYLDSYQDAPFSQPEAIGGYTPLAKTYSYNPVPDTIAPDIADYLIGIQGNLWCEYIPTAEQAEYMLYPRMFAIAEIGWTPDSLKNYDDFRARSIALESDFQKLGYNVFDLKTEIGNKPEAMRSEKHLALGKPVTYNVPWWNRYPAAGTATLTDGIRGGWNYSDQLWQGFLYRGEQRVDVTVDLESIQPIRYIGVEFMQLIGPGVWHPGYVEFQISDNGVDFTSLHSITEEQKPSDGVSFKTFDWKGMAKTRYIRVIARAKEGCQFLDEIIVR